MKKHLLISYFLILTNFCFAQNDSLFTETPLSLERDGYIMYGTLTLPKKISKTYPIVLFIAGSGPTDQNGNQGGSLNTNAYQMFCHALTSKNIASIRFDKFGAGKSRPENLKEMVAKRDFNHEVDDVVAWIAFVKKDKRFSQVIVVGHSLGALTGILAIQKTGKDVTKFISVAGVGKRGSDLLKEQLASQPKIVGEKANPIIDSLSNGWKVNNIPPFLNVLFNPSLQPYLISWFKYDPSDELAKLNISSLIIQGSKDIQIKVEDAQYLISKSKKAKLFIIPNMNHVLKILEKDDRASNLATYTQPTLPIAESLIQKTIDFIYQKAK